MSYPNIVLNTDPNLAFRQHDFIQIVHDENNYIDARVINYNVNTGELIVIPLEYHGSGSFDTWTISLSGEPGTDGGSGTSGISGTSGTSGAAFEILNKDVNRILRISGDGEDVIAASNLTFDGQTLSIAPLGYTAPGSNTHRIVYHNDGTAGTAGIIVRGPEFGNQYDGIIENVVPRDYQHRFVVGQQYVAHIDSEGIHSQSGLRVDGTEIYFPGIPENNDAQTDQARYLTFDPDDDGNGAGRIQWVTGQPSGTSGTSGTEGSSGTSGSTNLLSSVGWNTNKEYQIGNTEQLTFAGDYVLNNSDLYIEGSEENIEYAQDKFVRKIGKIYIGGNLIIKDSTIENNGEIGVGGSVILIGNSQITGTGIII